MLEPILTSGIMQGKLRMAFLGFQQARIPLLLMLGLVSKLLRKLLPLLPMLPLLPK